jgi:hypothetical protein
MNEETFNLSIRKFLKKFGINSQREIERAVRKAIEEGKLSGTEILPAKMTLEVATLGIVLTIGDDIALE